MTNTELSQRMEHLSEEMREVATEMLSNSNEDVVYSGKQLLGAANISLEWAQSIRGLQDE